LETVSCQWELGRTVIHYGFRVTDFNRSTNLFDVFGFLHQRSTSPHGVRVCVCSHRHPTYSYRPDNPPTPPLMASLAVLCSLGLVQSEARTSASRTAAGMGCHTRVGGGERCFFLRGRIFFLGKENAQKVRRREDVC